jgi:hypothetical protein
VPVFEFHCAQCSIESEVLLRSNNWQGYAESPSFGSPKLDENLSVFATTTSDHLISSYEYPRMFGHAQ